MYSIYPVFLGLFITGWYVCRAMFQAWLRGIDANPNAYAWADAIVRRIHYELFNMQIRVINHCQISSDGNLIVFGNHPDTISAMAYAKSLYETFPGRKVMPTARTGLIIGGGIRAIGGLVFDRNAGQAARRRIQRWLEQIDHNSIVTLFPDGKRGFPERIATEGRAILAKWHRLDLVPLYRFTMPASRGGVLQLRTSTPADTTWVRCTITLDRAFPRIWDVYTLHGAVITIQYDQVEPPPLDEAGIDAWLEKHFGFINQRIGEIRAGQPI